MNRKEFTEKEKEQLSNMMEEITAIYNFTGEIDSADKNWMGDTERFMAFTALHTKSLINHSMKLNKLTVWLIVLTFILTILTCGQIIIFLNSIYNWLE